MVGTGVAVLTALAINFFVPDIPNREEYLERDKDFELGFPYQYFKNEGLTDDQVEYRVKKIYLFSSIYLGILVSILPGLAPVTSSEIFIPSNSNQPSIVRGGAVIPGADGFQQLPTSRPPGSGSGNAVGGQGNIGGRGNSGKGASSGVSKPPRAPSGFQVRQPYCPAQRGHGGHGGGDGSGGSGSPGNGNDSNRFSPNKNKCPKPEKTNSPEYGDKKKKKKKKKRKDVVSKEGAIQAYQDFMKKMNKDGYQINVSEDRFLELSTNPQTGNFDEKSIFETQGGLELEAQGIIKNLRRTSNRAVDLDFMAERVGSGETIFVDHKGMIDFGSLADRGIDITGFPNHEHVAFSMGKESVKQKSRFIGMDQGPVAREDVLHLYNFQNIRNRAEVPFLMQAVLNGAKQAGYTDGIIFINYE